MKEVSLLLKEMHGLEATALQKHDVDTGMVPSSIVNAGSNNDGHPPGRDSTPAPVAPSKTQKSGRVQKPFTVAQSGTKAKSRRQAKLSCDQLRINHVTSEKKRREIVRNIYDELVDLVPDLSENENRSEQIIYMKTINYIRWLYEKNQKLRAQIYSKQKELKGDEPGFKIPDRLIWELKR